MPQAVTGAFRRLALITGAILALTACHKKPQEQPAAPVPAPASAPRPSVPLPPRTPGLWETTLSEEGSVEAPQVLKICIDALTDQHLGILGTDLSGDTCSKKTFNQESDNTWGLLAECDMGSGVVTEYSGSITGDIKTHYDMNVRSQTTGANQMNRVTNYVVASKRVGACASGQKPGDVINLGVKMNLFDMAGVKRGDAKSSAQSEGAAPDVVD